MATAVVFMATEAVTAVSAFAADTTVTVPCGTPSGGADGLRMAVEKANTSSGKTTIKLVDGCVYLFRGDYPTGSGNALPVVSSKIVITSAPGKHDNHAVVMRNNTTTPFRLIDVNTSGDLTLQHITVMGGLTNDGTMTNPDGGDGGGIRNTGRLLLDDAAVLANTTGNGRNGDPGDPTGDATGAPGGNGGRGGGVFNGGVLTLRNVSTVSGNITGNGGAGGAGATTGGFGGPGGSGGAGGGIYNDDGGTTTSNDQSVVTSNTTGNGGDGGAGVAGVGAVVDANGGPAGNGGNGAGIATLGLTKVTSVLLKGGKDQVTNNLTGDGGDGGDGAGLTGAGGNAGQGGDGGGVWASGKMQTFATDGASLTSNVTGDKGEVGSGDGTPAPRAGTDGNGGGLANEDESTAILKKGSITWNSAGGGMGGGVYSPAPITINGTVIKNNSPDQCSPPQGSCGI